MQFVHSGRVRLSDRKLERKAEEQLSEFFESRGVIAPITIEVFWTECLRGSGATARKVKLLSVDQFNPRGIQFAIQPRGNDTSRKIVAVIPHGIGDTIALPVIPAGTGNGNGDVLAVHRMLSAPSGAYKKVKPPEDDSDIKEALERNERARAREEARRQKQADKTALAAAKVILASEPTVAHESPQVTSSPKRRPGRPRKVSTPEPQVDRIECPKYHIPFEDFVRDSINQLRKEGPWIHTVYTNFNRNFRSYYGDDVDPVAVIKQLVSDRFIKSRPVKGGVLICLTASQETELPK